MLLDTHFVLWTALKSPRLDGYKWLERYRPWVVSPVSLLEIQFLSESGKVRVKNEFFDLIRTDSRFSVDEPAFDALIQAALPLSWTRDPFDRLLVAHSLIRRMPICTMDRSMQENHSLLPREL